MSVYRARRRIPHARTAALVVVALVLGAVGGFVASRRPTDAPRALPPATASGATSAPTTAPATTGTGTLSVASISPASGAVAVTPAGALTVTFSSPLAASSALPSLAPSQPGAWQRQGDQVTFTPSVPFAPLTDVTLTVPGGPSGVLASNGGRLAQSEVTHFRVANGSVLRLQQILSLLDYSPLAWSPVGTAPAAGDATGQLGAAFSPPNGTFTWRAGGWPARLRALWQPGVDNLFTRGLVMSFQADHGLTPNGHVGAGLWGTLLSALGANTLNTGGYNYALANKTAPESLTVYHDGRVVLRSSANTGIAGSPTPDGTFAVYTRLRRQVMHGTNPNGQAYADLVQYIAYFHGNDAVHYMDRADYGIPQSLGCIELPLTDAARAWPYLAYGTLVSVIG